MKEIWKPIVGFEGVYSVSNLGRVRREDTGRIRKSSLDKKAGYEITVLSFKKKRMTQRVHVLVARAFIGPRPVGEVVNHKDSVRSNNHSRNLEYVTSQENFHHAVKQGRLRQNGEDSHLTKLTETQVLEIRQIYTTSKPPQKEVAAQYGVGFANISAIILRKSWRHI